MKGFVGMQVYPFDYADEGVEDALENMSNKAGVNAIISIVNMIDERHPWSGKFPHNPKRASYVSKGGYVYFQPQIELYSNTNLKPMRTNEDFLKEFDVLKDTVALSRGYGMKSFAWLLCFENVIHGKRYPDTLRMDIDGKLDSTGKLCINNPLARNYCLDLILDIVSNHEIDGIFLDRLRFFRPDEIGNVFSCFCKHCMEKANETGYDISSLKKSAQQVKELLGQITGENLKKFSQLNFGISDVLKRVPEVSGILDWVEFRSETVAEFVREVRNLIKDSGQNAEIALNLQPPSYSWLLGQDYRRLEAYCDWIKIMAYPQMRGKMIVNIIRSKKTFRNLDVKSKEEEALKTIYAFLGINGPLTFAETEKGLPADYVFIETLRAKSELGSGGHAYSGIQLFSATQKDVESQMQAAKKAGTDGVVYTTYGYAPFENFEIAKQAWESD